MREEETLKDVLNDQAGKVVEDFVEDDALKIELVRKFNGKWDITAHFQ